MIAAFDWNFCLVMFATFFIYGGSLAKGTAIKGECGIDLVIFLKDYSDVRTLHGEFSSLLKALKRHLKSYTKVRIVGKSKFAVQVEVPCQAGYDYSVDIFPSLTLNKCKCPLQRMTTDMTSNTVCHKGVPKYALLVWLRR